MVPRSSLVTFSMPRILSTMGLLQMIHSQRNVGLLNSVYSVI
jgi:hypothetical protein